MNIEHILQEFLICWCSCWLRGNALLYGFVLPVGVVLVANCVTFCIIIFGIYGRKRDGLRTNQPQKELAKSQLRATICIVFLLGLTWVFAYLVILQGVPPDVSRLFEYLFVGSSTTQGFVIFIFHVAHEKTAREFWLIDILYRILPWKKQRSCTSNVTRNGPTPTAPARPGPWLMDRRIPEVHRYKNARLEHAFLRFVASVRRRKMSISFRVCKIPNSWHQAYRLRSRTGFTHVKVQRKKQTS